MELEYASPSTHYEDPSALIGGGSFGANSQGSFLEEKKSFSSECFYTTGMHLEAGPEKPELSQVSSCGTPEFGEEKARDLDKSDKKFSFVSQPDPRSQGKKEPMNLGLGSQYSTGETNFYQNQFRYSCSQPLQTKIYYGEAKGQEERDWGEMIGLEIENFNDLSKAPSYYSSLD
jgi:hypothetical protein